jgi:hypothetical protein
MSGHFAGSQAVTRDEEEKIPMIELPGAVRPGVGGSALTDSAAQARS